MKFNSRYFLGNNFCEVNLIFASVAILKELAAHEEYSLTKRLAALAELLVRKYHLGNNALDEFLGQYIGPAEINEFNLFLDRNLALPLSGQKLPERLWASRSEFAEQCHIVLQNRLHRLFLETDGFIPVFDAQTEMGYFLPFQLQETTGQSGIFDHYGHEITPWQKFYPEIFSDEPQWHCQVFCRYDAQNLPLDGNSFMLPVYLAAARKQNRIAYDPLRLLASGAIRQGHIYPVDYKIKLQALHQCFPSGYLTCPQSSQTLESDDRLIALPAEISQAELFPILNAKIEEESLIFPTWKEAQKRLAALIPQINHSLIKWEDVFKRLNCLQKSLSQRTDPKNYLLVLMLKSTLRCHQGHTADALKLNEEAQKFAQKHSGQYVLYQLRMQIEQMVMLNDLEEFDKLAMTQDLQNKIEATNDCDLKMRFYGTMGQIAAYAFWGTGAKFTPEQSKTYFELALANACQLDSPPDIAQDLNYLYLWYALFAPESPQEAEAYQEAKNFIRANLTADCRNKNLNFLQREKNLSRYRHFLLTGDSGEANLKLCHLSADFIPCFKEMNYKYLGTLYAGRGQYSEALECFTRAIQSTYQDPVLMKLSLTCAGQALGALRDSQVDLTRFTTKFQQLSAQLKDIHPQTVQAWQNYLSGQSTHHPDLNYWY